MPNPLPETKTYITISGAIGDTGDDGSVSGATGRIPGRVHIETKGGDLSDVQILWVGDSHAKRIFFAAPDDPAVATGYAWLAIQQGWEGVLDDIVGQVSNSGGAPRVFLSLGSRGIGVAGLTHSEVLCYLLEVAKRFINQGVSFTLMELPFGCNTTHHLETWRTSCAVRGINTLILGSSPAAGLLLQTVTSREDKTQPLALGSSFPMRRDISKYADLVHLRDPAYKEVWDETLKENTKNSFSDPKDAWMIERGEVTTLVTPVGIEKSWADFIQGKRQAHEVQLWTPDELHQSPPHQWRQQLDDWQPWSANRSRGGRARGGPRGRRGYRGRGRVGRGYGGRGRRPYWERPSTDRRPQGSINFNYY